MKNSKLTALLEHSLHTSHFFQVKSCDPVVDIIDRFHFSTNIPGGIFTFLPCREIEKMEGNDLHQMKYCQKNWGFVQVTTQKIKFSIKDSSVNVTKWPNPQEIADLVTLHEKSLMENFVFHAEMDGTHKIFQPGKFKHP